MKGPKSWLELSANGLRSNLAGVRRLVGPAEIMAVLKSNAYGHGAAGAAGVLAEEGIRSFAVATVEEGVALREANIKGRITCLSHVLEDELQDLLQHELTPTLHGSALVEPLCAATEALNVWAKVDTGLNRLGIPHQEAPEFLQALADTTLRIEGVYSTLTENPDRASEQLVSLQRLRALPVCAQARFSLSSSQAILSLPEAYLDVVRPGIMLLGFEPSETSRMDTDLLKLAALRPIATWKARVAQVRIARRGQQVGYGIKPRLDSDLRLAVLTVGWADGYAPRACEACTVLINNRHCPVLEVSANSTIAVLGADTETGPGAEAVLLGRQGDGCIETQALAGVSGGVYQMLAGIPRHVPREWR